MSLSRMCRLTGLCSHRSLLCKKPVPKNARFFKRNRNEESRSEQIPNVTLESNINGVNLWKPFCFTIGFSGACFVGVSIWEYESMRSHAAKMLRKPMKLFKKSLETQPDKSNRLVKEIEAKWNSLTAGEKVFVPICALNVLVFGMWRIPRLQPFMLRFFCSNPGGKHVYSPMILSTFSHYSGFHLLANMYVLHSFSSGAVHSLGKEQFLGLYLSAGVISSFTSYLYKVLTKQPGLSLGASGAIMAILGYVCTQYPDTRLGIILVPFFTFSAGSAIKAIMALDTAGVVLGWKFFDHAAHLGGATFGIFWALYGNKYIWQKREPVLHYWHKLRGSIK